MLIKQNNIKSFTSSPIYISPYNNNIKGAGGVFIYNVDTATNQIFILLGKEYNGTWNIAMGKREPNEPFINTAIRELKEEMHIDLSINDIKNNSYCIDVQQPYNQLCNKKMCISDNSKDNQLSSLNKIEYRKMPSVLSDIHSIIMTFLVPVKERISEDIIRDQIKTDDYLSMIDYQWVPLNLLLNTKNKFITLDSGKELKLRNCLRLLIRLLIKRKLINKLI